MVNTIAPHYDERAMTKARSSRSTGAAVGDGGADADGGATNAAQVVTFRSGHRAEIVRGQPQESLTLRARDGQCVLAIEITDQGTVLRLSGGALEINAAATLSLQAKHFELNADSAAINVGGDLVERVAGDACREVGGAASLLARDVGIEATRGGVTVQANDDVDVRGERVRLNCDDPPMPLTWEELRERQRALATTDGPVAELADSHDSSGARPLDED